MAQRAEVIWKFDFKENEHSLEDIYPQVKKILEFETLDNFKNCFAILDNSLVGKCYEKWFREEDLYEMCKKLSKSLNREISVMAFIESDIPNLFTLDPIKFVAYKMEGYERQQRIEKELKEKKFRQLLLECDDCYDTYERPEETRTDDGTRVLRETGRIQTVKCRKHQSFEL